MLGYDYTPSPFTAEPGPFSPAHARSRASSRRASDASDGPSILRTHRRSNSMSSISSQPSGRKRSKIAVSDDENEDDVAPAVAASSRAEATRRQRIESEQRRRDELREGYASLKKVLPVPGPASKPAILDEATKRIKDLELQLALTEAKIQEEEAEARRLAQ